MHLLRCLDYAAGATGECRQEIRVMITETVSLLLTKAPMEIEKYCVKLNSMKFMCNSLLVSLALIIFLYFGRRE